jgi:CRISPR-associated protein Cmr5
MTAPAKNTMQTLEQRRAKHAWNVIQRLKRAPEKAREEFVTEAKKLPLRIRGAGLGQALAFLEAKSDKKQGAADIPAALSEWVLRERAIRGEKPDSLILSVIEGNAEFLRRATDECLAYLEWLNRFAEAELKSESSRKAGGDVT